MGPQIKLKAGDLVKWMWHLDGVKDISIIPRYGIVIGRPKNDGRVQWDKDRCWEVLIGNRCGVYYEDELSLIKES